MANPTKPAEPTAPAAQVVDPADQKATNLKAKIKRLSTYKQTPDVKAAIARAEKHLTHIHKRDESK
jgi:hypothetical protein